MKTSLHATMEDLSPVKSYAKPIMDQGGNEVVAVMLEEATRSVEEGSDQEEHVREMLDMGVEVRACENSMRRNDVDESDLIDGVETVTAGPVELSQLHDDGYAYMKV